MVLIDNINTHTEAFIPRRPGISLGSTGGSVNTCLGSMMSSLYNSRTRKISGMAVLNASTMVGSKYLPDSEITQAVASSTAHAFLYGRTEVNASNTSATEQIRAKIGICSPAKPCGYPVPSNARGANRQYPARRQSTRHYPLRWRPRYWYAFS